MTLEPDGVLARSSWELVCEKWEWVISSSLESQGTTWDSLITYLWLLLSTRNEMAIFSVWTKRTLKHSGKHWHCPRFQVLVIMSNSNLGPSPKLGLAMWKKTTASLCPNNCPCSARAGWSSEAAHASGPGSVTHIGWKDTLKGKGVSLKLPCALCAKQQLGLEGQKITRVCFLLHNSNNKEKRKSKRSREGGKMKRKKRRKGRFVDACYVPGTV